MALLCLGAAGPGAMAQSAQSAQSAQPDDKVTFSIAVAKLAMAASNPLAAGKQPKAVVSVTLAGRLYDPPRDIRPAVKGKIDRTGISGALASDYGANLAGDLDWMAAGFVEAERGDLKRYFNSDPQLLEYNQDATDRIEQLFLMGEVSHGKYRLALVIRDHGGRTFRRIYGFLPVTPGGTVTKDGATSVIPVTPVTKVWLRSNALRADSVFDVVFSAFLWGKITAAGKSVR